MTPQPQNLRERSSATRYERPNEGINHMLIRARYSSSEEGLPAERRADAGLFIPVLRSSEEAWQRTKRSVTPQRPVYGERGSVLLALKLCQTSRRYAAHIVQRAASSIYVLIRK